MSPKYPKKYGCEYEQAYLCKRAEKLGMTFP
jgi:hypothetical protein